MIGYRWEREVPEGLLKSGPQKLGRCGCTSWAVGRWGEQVWEAGESEFHMTLLHERCILDIKEEVACNLSIWAARSLRLPRKASA